MSGTGEECIGIYLMTWQKARGVLDAEMWNTACRPSVAIHFVSCNNLDLFFHSRGDQIAVV
jgi:hypothetical protein